MYDDFGWAHEMLDELPEDEPGPRDAVSEEEFDHLVFYTPPSHLERLRRNSSPLPGRPGTRIDARGRIWYSSEWLGLLS